MSTNDNYGFLFIGAGKATYFEFARIQVVFKNTANKEQKTTYIDKSIEWLSRQLDPSQEAHRKVVIEYLDTLLSFKNKLSPKIFEELCKKLWYCTYKEGEKGLMGKIPKSKSLGDTIGYKSWKALMAAKFEESRELYQSINNR